MTDLPSASPYAYLDDLSPAERQAEIARRQHQRREEWCDDARRARDYQAELAELEDAFTENMECYESMLIDYRVRIAELEAALEPFVEFADMVEDKYRKRGGNPDIFPDAHPFCDIKAKEIRMGYWRAARAALHKPK